MKEITVKWSELIKPTPRQLTAIQTADNFDYLLYGGAVGGGKSYFLRWYPLRFLHKLYVEKGLKNVVAGLFCEDYPALTDRHLSKIQFEFPKWIGDWDGKMNGFRLKEQFGGGILVFRNLDDPSKYQSAEFALVAIDELTKNSKEVFDFLRLRKRWPGVEHTKFIAGSNPGGIGHGWVKKLWFGREFEKTEKEADQFKLVPATARDNPHLSEMYYATLEGLPPDMRRAYIEGDWDMFKGQFFTEWRRDLHVRPVFKIPSTFRKFMGIDFGSTAPFACYWIAVDWDKNYWVYKEYYAKGRDAETNAKNILSMMDEEERVEFAVADRAIFAKQGYGETIADILRRNGIGQPGTKIPMLEPSVGGKNTRIARAQLMRQKLRHDEHTVPKIRFFETCREAIRTIPELIHDERNSEDVDTEGEDHAYDAITYAIQKLEEVRVDKPMNRVESKLNQLKQQEENSSFNTRFNKSV